MIVQCTHWSARPSGMCGNCAKGLYGGRPSPGICLRACADYEGPPRENPVSLTVSASQPVEPMPLDLPWFIHGASGLLRWWLRIGRAEQATAAARLDICRSCEHFDEQRVRCAKCGCRLRAKVSDALEACPVGKW